MASSLVLAALRYLFIIMLYLFLFRVIRLMFSGINEPKEKLYAHNMSIPDDAVRPEKQSAALPAPVARLTVEKGSGAYLKDSGPFYLGERTSLGRGIDNHIIVSDPSVTHEHAVIYLREGQYWLQDLGSKNGTFLNERLLETPTVLAHGDRLRIGSTAFQFLRWSY